MMMMETVKVYAGEDGRLGLSYLMQRKELCAVTIYKDNVWMQKALRKMQTLRQGYNYSWFRKKTN